MAVAAQSATTTAPAKTAPSGLTDRAKADLMGQAKFLKDTYVSRGELHLTAAVFLDAALH